MKKTFIGLFAIAMIAGTIVSCKKDKTVDCTTATANAQKAAQAFATEQSVANCNAYKAALQDLIKSTCFSSFTTEQKAAYEEQVNGLDCDMR